MYLTCVREDATIKIYTEYKELIYVCKAYNKFVREGWNVYDPTNTIVLNYNVDMSWFALFKGVTNPCKITSVNGLEFNLISVNSGLKLILKGMRFKTIGLSNGEFSAGVEKGILIMRDSNDNVIAEVESDAGDYWDHSSKIKYYQDISFEVLIALYLPIEMYHPVSYWNQG